MEKSDSTSLKKYVGKFYGDVEEDGHLRSIIYFYKIINSSSGVPCLIANTIDFNRKMLYTKDSWFQSDIYASGLEEYGDEHMFIQTLFRMNLKINREFR